MIEICIAVYRRATRIPEIIKQLNKQTNQNFRLNIWNNSPYPLDLSRFPRERLTVVHSKENEGSCSRFKLVPLTRGNPIIFFDDDEDLENDFVEYNYQQWMKFGENSICGWYSKIWNPEYGYLNSLENLPYGTEVDYLGTGGMILDRSIFDKDERLQDMPPEYSKVEDLYLSALARTVYGMRLISIEPKCKIVYDGLDQCKGLKGYKENAFTLLRQEGWKLLKEKNLKKNGD